VALVLARILQYKLAKEEKNYSVGQIIDSLSKCCCTHFQENIWTLKYIDNVLEDIGNIFDINFKKKSMTLQEIKKILSNSKKSFT